MKLTRLLCGLTFGLLLAGGIGCKSEQVIVPTDVEAKQRAQQDPGQPKAAGKAGESTSTAPQKGATSPFNIKGMPDSDKK